MSDRIEKTIDLKAPVARVWSALTDHEQFGAWFRVRLDAPFQVGRPSTGHMTWPGYEHIRWNADVVRMDEPEVFAFTWHPYAIDQSQDYSDETPTLVEFRLEPLGQGTRLQVIESGFDKVPERRRAEAFRMNDSGWSTQVKNIQAYVESQPVQA